MIAVDLLYLRATLAGLGIVLGLYFFFPERRQVMLIHGLTLMPMSFLSIWHQDTYWSPDRLFGGRYGIEDIIFCFSVGSLTGLAAYLPRRRPVHIRFEPIHMMNRSLYLAIIAGILFFCGWLLDIDIMSATIIIQMLLIGMLSYLRKTLVLPALRAMVIYTAYYCSFVLGFQHFYPSFLQLWNGRDLWPYRIGLLPIEEIVWVSTFSCAWVLIVGYATGIATVNHSGSEDRPTDLALKNENG